MACLYKFLRKYKWNGIVLFGIINSMMFLMIMYWIKVIREDWEPINFIDAVNCGDYRVEFITQYKSYQSILFKCWVWFEKSPYHYECEIILHTEQVTYNWNQLRYDCVW